METDKHRAILAEAHKHFARFGYKKTSVDDIAKAAGVAKGTVYLAAPSKADLFYEVMLRELREWNADIQRLIDPRIPADQLLVLCSEQSLATLPERPLVRDLLLGEVDDLVPALKDRLPELRAIGESIAQEILRLGQRQGVFRDDLDIEALGSILLDLQCATILFHYDGDALSPKLVRRAAAGFDLLLRGLKKSP